MFTLLSAIIKKKYMVWAKSQNKKKVSTLPNLTSAEMV